MKKLFLAVLVCAILSFGLMGCGKKHDAQHPAGQEHPHTEHPK